METKSNNTQPMGIRLFYVTGDLNGIRAVSAASWPNTAIAVPSHCLLEFKKYPEAVQPSVSILLGADPNSLGEINGYIGATGTPWKRLAEHANDSAIDWWTEAIILTSPSKWFDASPRKWFEESHAKYVERDLWKCIVQAGSIKLTNLQEPDEASILETDLAEARAFMCGVNMVIPPLSAKAAQIFQPKIVENASGQEFVLSSGRATAKMVQSPQGYVVLKGSTAVKESSESTPQGYRIKKESLIANGMLAANDAGSLVFTKNTVFTNSSAAASVLTGTSCSGPQTWKTIDGRTLRDFEADDSVD